MTTIAHSNPRDVLRAQNEGGVEYADGHIVEKPVSIESSEVEANIAFLLKLEARKGAAVHVFPASMGYQCFRDDPTRFRKPDVSVVRAERLAGIDRTTGLMPFAPDLAVEVVSPNDLSSEVAGKTEDYLQNGFLLVWIVEPATQTVMIYRADGTVAHLRAADDITGESAIPTFRCKVADFFKI